MNKAIPSLSKFFASDNSELPRGEHALLVHFLFRGILDLVNAEYWIQANSLLWLADERAQSDRHFPFVWTCAALGVDPHAVRRAVADRAQFARIICAVANDGRIQPGLCQCQHLLDLLPQVTPKNFHWMRDQVRAWLKQREKEQRRRTAWNRHCSSSGQTESDSPWSRDDPDTV